jgi:hypothetical protein
MIVKLIELEVSKQQFNWDKFKIICLQNLHKVVLFKQIPIFPTIDLHSLVVNEVRRFISNALKSL